MTSLKLADGSLIRNAWCAAKHYSETQKFILNSSGEARVYTNTKYDQGPQGNLGKIMYKMSTAFMLDGELEPGQTE